MSLQGLIEDSAWLFDFGFPMRRLQFSGDASHVEAWSLGVEHRLPNLHLLSTPERGFTARMAWGEQGVFLELEYPSDSSKSGTGEFSAALQFYIDTRSSPGIHRANSNCHCFDFRYKQPRAEVIPHRPMQVSPLPIPRAKSLPKFDRVERVRGWCSSMDGIDRVKIFVPTESLTGCDPFEFPEWGVNFVAVDARYRRYALARQSHTVPLDDPSLWCRARLVEND
jgi:hypothetical protein